MTSRSTRPFFLFFLVSGFCGLVHEVVWIRLSMAVFGTTTPSISTVLSVFMAGLAIGSFGAGRLTRRLSAAPRHRFLELYAVSEVVIALSAWIVPAGLTIGRRLLTDLSRETAWQDAGFLASSGAVVAVTLLPFAIAMGATFPLAMAAIGGSDAESPRTFGYLYAANVLGAATGVLASGFVLIELLGFRKTLVAAAAANVALAIASWLLARTWAASASPRTAPRPRVAAPASESAGPGDRAAMALLFTTGFVSMAMEVVWIRMFTPYLGPVVYTFSAILALYLGATFLGSWAWRFRTGDRGGSVGAAWLAAALLSLLPLLTADPHLPLPAGVFPGAVRVALAIPAFCAVLGWLTPRLVDLASLGDPARAGRAYAANVVGCILGPLAAGFVLLPALGEKGSIVSLAAILLLSAVAFHGREIREAVAARPLRAAASCVAAIVIVLWSRDFDSVYPDALVRRDYEATVIAATEDSQKRLFVNGYGMTSLTPITKMMVHVPLSMAKEPPRNALVICFGMGTSFRSAMSWGIPVTTVELVPSIPGLVGFYHEDGPALLRSPRARIVIDDGRRFFERSREEWDLIVVDPPPPIEAAGSSLLYSKEFTALARSRLSPGGIFQQWLPAEDPDVVTAVTRALVETFPHVRAFRSCENWGTHFFASDRPIEVAPPAVLAGRLPPAALADLMEWWPGAAPASAIALVTTQELPIETLLNADPSMPALTDDRPVNEYCLLRRLLR